MTQALPGLITPKLDRLAHGWSSAKIHFQHPHLSLAQIHAALSCNYDHQSEFDEQINRRLKEVERLANDARRCGNSAVRQRLRAAGKRP